MRNIAELDKNFAVQTQFDLTALDIYSWREEPFSLHGVYYDETQGAFLRLDPKIAAQVNDGVAYHNTNTAGGRLRFSTDSKTLTLLVDYAEYAFMPHMPLSGSCGFALCENTDEGEIFCGMVAPDFAREEKIVRQFILRGDKMRSYTLHFPLYQGVKDLHLAVEKGNTFAKGTPYRDCLPVLYYGSSITQGGCASRADTSYEGFISKKNNVDFINLGFSGSAKAEPVMIDYLTGIQASVAVFDYDYNAPDAAHLQKTHYALYKAYRDAHPTTPIVLISKPNYAGDPPMNEARFAVIKQTYERAKAEGDTKVYLIEGKSFFGEEWHLCMVDNCHPTDLGFYRMAQVIGKLVNELIS